MKSRVIHLIKRLDYVSDFLNEFGILNGGKVVLKRKIRREKETAVKLPYIKNEIYIRNDTSDWYTFEQIFLKKEYAHSILENIEPKFIIDAGANVGYSSIFFANKFPDAKIIAIEPEDSNFKLLARNTSLYKNVEPIKAGLWYEECNLIIKNKDTDKNAFIVGEQSRSTNLEMIINALTVSTILEKYNQDYIDILKIDIECAEKLLFSHNYESWLSKVKVLIIELHDFIEPGCAKAFFSAISKYDFTYSKKGQNQFISFANTH